MNAAAKFKQIKASLSSRDEKSQAAIRDRIMLQLARIVILIMLSLTGFLINHYLNSIHKTMDHMGLAIEEMGDMQRQIAITLIRMDENVRNIERRLEKTEIRLEHPISKNP